MKKVCDERGFTFYSHDITMYQSMSEADSEMIQKNKAEKLRENQYKYEQISRFPSDL